MVEMSPLAPYALNPPAQPARTADGMVTTAPTPWVPLYTPPTSGWEGAVDGSGRFISNNFPIITGVQRALVSSPRRGDANSLSGGIKGVVNGLAFQYLVNKGHQVDGYLKQTFPAYGEFANRHPIMSGAITFVGIFLPASTLAAFVSENRWVGKVADWVGIGGKKALQSNQAGRLAIGAWHKTKGILRHPVSLAIQGIALVALMVGLLVKGTRDSVQFKQAYKKVRQEYPNRQQVPPDVLRASVVSVLNQQKLTKAYSY